MEKILIIEDELIIREEVADWLRFEGYEVLAAPNGREGLEIALREIPDLILCDIAMPAMTGHEVLLEIRSHARLNETSFIFITASIERASRRYGMQLGADDYITKPFSHEELMNAIHSCFGKIARHQKKISQQLKMMQSALDSEREERVLKSQLVGMFSHDFRTPLSVIMTSATLVRDYEDRLSPERKKGKLDQIMISARRLIHMLDDMLLVAEIGSDQFQFVPEHLNLSTAVSQIVADFQDMHEKTHKIKIDIAPNLMLYTDPKLVYQIVSNVVSNAVKYSPEGSCVSVYGKYDPAGDQIEIRVTDEGIGIPADILESLFDPFLRASNAKAIQGTGLGLTIVRQALDLCGGDIVVESEVGNGSTFRILLPMKP